MISLQRVYGVFLRYFYSFARLDHLSDLLYWPAIDIFLWGITSLWLQKMETGVPHIAVAILTGLVFWGMLWRGTNDIAVNLLQELWARNLINLFSTPLKLVEWMIAVMCVGFVKVLVSLFFAAALILILYALNVFNLGWAFIPFSFSLLLSGWAIGFFTAGLIVYTGQRLQQLAWMMPYIFSPFAAIYYPLSALPDWAQSVAHGLPMTYIFEGMRDILYNGVFSIDKLVMSFILNIVYLILSMIFFTFMFHKSRAKGLGRLE